MKKREPAGFNHARATAEKVARDAARIAGLVGEAYRKAEKKKGTLGAVRENIVTLIDLIRAWASGEYRDVPWQTIVFALAALVYFVNPFDVVPDMVPLFGLLDDATVIGFVLASIKREIESFRRWRGEGHAAAPGEKPTNAPGPSTVA